jgi:hypothetical protein
MRVVCLVNEIPGGIAFVNRVHRELGVDLAVLAQAPGPREALIRKHRSGGARAVADAVRGRLGERLRASRQQEARDLWFGDRWRAIDGDVPLLRMGSVNDPLVAERARALGDVLLLVHVDAIIGNELLDASRFAFNLHWGLAPYYRGTRCTEWALIHWDPLNIGVTLHHVTSVLDGGAIVGQARAEVRPGDTVHSINAQLTALGTEIAIETARAIRAGSDVPGIPQDLDRGIMTYKRQWSGELRRYVSRLERAGLKPVLDAPARGRLPIVELVTGGEGVSRRSSSSEPPARADPPSDRVSYTSGQRTQALGHPPRTGT